MINVKAVAETVLKFSPAVATALGSPVAGLVLSSLASLFKVAPENLASTIASDPLASDKIKQYEIEHSDELAKLATDDYQIDEDDRKSARETEVKLKQLTGKTDWVLSAIAIIVTIGFFILCVLNYFYPIRDDHVLIMLIGQVSSGFVMVLSFYFGASKKQS